MAEKRYTAKQMGDAGEMLIAAELTLAGLPAFTVPNHWPGYDVIAQPPTDWNGDSLRAPGTIAVLQRISVKTRTFAESGNFVGYATADIFDWLAIVILPAQPDERRQIFILPRAIAEKRSYDKPRRSGRGFFVHRLIAWPPIRCEAPIPVGGWGLADYEDNFRLNPVARVRDQV